MNKIDYNLCKDGCCFKCFANYWLLVISNIIVNWLTLIVVKIIIYYH